MAKLTSEQKQLFTIYCEAMAENNIYWAYCRETGITVVYQVMPGGKFIRASVAYCSKEDVFKKKIGLNAAMWRWERGEYVLAYIRHNPQNTVFRFVEGCVCEEVDLVHATPEDYWLGK